MTLTQVSIITKKGIVTFAAFLVLGIISAIGYRVWYNYYISTIPPVEEKPDLKFGILPEIIFPDSKVSSANYSYSVDTQTGSFSPVPKIIKVYFIPRANIVSLLAPDQSQKLAEKFNFKVGRQILNPTTYQYLDDTNGSFTIDLITGNFNYQKQIATSSAVFDNTFDTIFNDPQQFIDDFKALLKTTELFNDDLSNGRTKVTYNKSTPQFSTSAILSIWPSDIDKLQIVTPSTSFGLIRTTAISAIYQSTRYPVLNYTYWQVDKTTFATYPLQPIESAFAELQSGLGYVTQIPPTDTKISITKAYLAYFEADEYSPYLQPVYVFEGPNFTALVPAIAK